MWFPMMWSSSANRLISSGLSRTKLPVVVLFQHVQDCRRIPVLVSLVEGQIDELFLSRYHRVRVEGAEVRLVLIVPRRQVIPKEEGPPLRLCRARRSRCHGRLQFLGSLPAHGARSSGRRSCACRCRSVFRCPGSLRCLSCGSRFLCCSSLSRLSSRLLRCDLLLQPDTRADLLRPHCCRSCSSQCQ